MLSDNEADRLIEQYDFEQLEQQLNSYLQDNPWITVRRFKELAKITSSRDAKSILGMFLDHYDVYFYPHGRVPEIVSRMLTPKLTKRDACDYLPRAAQIVKVTEPVRPDFSNYSTEAQRILLACSVQDTVARL